MLNQEKGKRRGNEEKKKDAYLCPSLLISEKMKRCFMCMHVYACVNNIHQYSWSSSPSTKQNA